MKKKLMKFGLPVVITTLIVVAIVIIRKIAKNVCNQDDPIGI